MPPKRRHFRTFARALMPVCVMLLLAVCGLTVWLVRKTIYPQSSGYLVTPDGFRDLDARGLKATNETWVNADGTQARGWLLRGTLGAPAVLLLHRYDTDRSWLLNLGVTLNSLTNYTVLWTDLRGHGPYPHVKWTSFGTQETEDVSSALNFLRSLEGPEAQPYVGPIGIYGIEMGAYAALQASARTENNTVRALVLDSVPQSPDYMLQASLTRHVGSDNWFFRSLARLGTRAYLLSRYQDTPSCDAAAKLLNRHILLLSGPEAPVLRDSTAAVARCLPQQNQIEPLADTSPLGFGLPYLPGAQGDAYNHLVIDFFDRTLRNPDISPRFRFPSSKTAETP